MNTSPLSILLGASQHQQISFPYITGPFLAKKIALYPQIQSRTSSAAFARYHSNFNKQIIKTN